MIEILKEYPREGAPSVFVTIHEGIGGWNSSVWGWTELTQNDIDMPDTHPDCRVGDGFYEPLNTGFTNTSLGTGLKADAIKDAMGWAEDEETPIYIPECKTIDDVIAMIKGLKE